MELEGMFVEALAEICGKEEQRALGLEETEIMVLAEKKRDFAVVEDDVAIMDECEAETDGLPIM